MPSGKPDFLSQTSSNKWFLNLYLLSRSHFLPELPTYVTDCYWNSLLKCLPRTPKNWIKLNYVKISVEYLNISTTAQSTLLLVFPVSKNDITMKSKTHVSFLTPYSFTLCVCWVAKSCQFYIPDVLFSQSSLWPILMKLTPSPSFLPSRSFPLQTSLL